MIRSAGRPLGATRVANQVHAGLLGRAPALAPVARDAAGDDVLPVLASALRDRHDVVERQVGASANACPQYWHVWWSRA